MRVLPPFVHRCTVQSGSLAGNKHEHEVTALEAEYGDDCDVCGRRLATPEQIAIHIYRELTE